MESTRKYWIPISSILEKTCNVWLIHPKYVKGLKSKKTDKKDAKWIAELFKCELVCASFISPSDIRQPRDLCRYYAKFTFMTTSEKNRSQNFLTTCNFKLDTVFSDVFDKSARRILDNVITLGHSNFDVAPLLDWRYKTSIEEVKVSLDSELSFAQSEKLKIIRKHMDNL